MKNCAVRTYAAGCSITTEYLNEKLKEGWTIKMCTPMQSDTGKTVCIEYILEKQEEKQ